MDKMSPSKRTKRKKENIESRTEPIKTTLLAKNCRSTNKTQSSKGNLPPFEENNIHWFKVLANYAWNCFALAKMTQGDGIIAINSEAW